MPKPLSQVFPFFSEAQNLDAITPAFLRFEILSQVPVHIRPGMVIEYRIRILGVPQRWKTRIEAFEPPRRFVDVQLKGPYALWRHTHEFVETGGGTLIRDHVEYEMPLGLLGELTRAFLVKHTLEKIFDFRAARIAEIFGSEAPRPA